MPLCVLSLMWGMCAKSVQDVCQTFVSLSLATLSAGDMDNRMVALHEMQLQYCFVVKKQNEFQGFLSDPFT
jgi:hypothetical protein